MYIDKERGWKTVYVHRMVAETWCPNWYKGCIVNHIDGNKSNNKASNLENTTQSDNTSKAYDKSEGMNSRLCPVRQYTSDGLVSIVHKSILAASRFSGCNDRSITYACDHKTEHKGYLWEYVKAAPETQVEDGMKKCSCCLDVYPLTSFKGANNRELKMCPKCVEKTNKGRSKEQAKFAAEVIPEGMKRCTGHCRRVLPIQEFIKEGSGKELKMCTSCRQYQLARFNKRKEENANNVVN